MAYLYTYIDTAMTQQARKTAHTEDKSVTVAVFHAPMFALNADADMNACEPTVSSPQAMRRIHDLNDSLADTADTMSTYIAMHI